MTCHFLIDTIESALPGLDTDIYQCQHNIGMGQAIRVICFGHAYLYRLTHEIILQSTCVRVYRSIALVQTSCVNIYKQSFIGPYKEIKREFAIQQSPIFRLVVKHSVFTIWPCLSNTCYVCV